MFFFLSEVSQETMRVFGKDRSKTKLKERENTKGIQIKCSGSFYKEGIICVCKHPPNCFMKEVTISLSLEE